MEGGRSGRWGVAGHMGAGGASMAVGGPPEDGAGNGEGDVREGEGRQAGAAGVDGGGRAGAQERAAELGGGREATGGRGRQGAGNYRVPTL